MVSSATFPAVDGRFRSRAGDAGFVGADPGDVGVRGWTVSHPGQCGVPCCGCDRCRGSLGTGRFRSTVPRIVAEGQFSTGRGREQVLSTPSGVAWRAPGLLCRVVPCNENSPFPERAQELARRQDGAITSLQLVECGVGEKVRRRHIRDRMLLRLARGLYCTAQPTWRTRARGGLLLAGEQAAIGGWHALALRGIAVSEERLETDVQVWSPVPQTHRPRPGWQFRRDSANRLERAPHQVLTIAEAVLDLCADLPHDRATGLLLDLLRDGTTHTAALREVLAQRHPGLVHHASA